MERALEGATGVELTIAAYDGIVRFMRQAIDAVERGDTHRRRTAVKRAMDIILHLQATLNRDIGGKPAEALEEFYVAMLALMLQGSQANSRKKFEDVITNVWNVREAWRQVAQYGDGSGAPPFVTPESDRQPSVVNRSESSHEVVPVRWTV
jgi:flagellar protein FliS